VLHDVVVAGVVLLAGLVVTRHVPRVARAPVAVGAVVLATVTLVAVPVLLSYGRKADNPTLLDRDYGAGWLVVAGVIVATVVVAVVVRARRGRVTR
jgi:NhaP-type Na+/H+ or K+/H+ antiporter